jgi:hypothetical protein
VKRQLCKPTDDGVDNRVWVYAIRAEAFEDKSPSDRLEPDKLQIRGNEGLKAHLKRYSARERSGRTRKLTIASTAAASGTQWFRLILHGRESPGSFVRGRSAS